MNPRPAVRFAVAVAVLLIGLMSIHLAGAPSSLLWLQGLFGLAALALAAGWPRWEVGDRTALALAVAGLALLAATFLHPGLEGVHRWLSLGPLLIQPAPLALPLIVWCAVRHSSSMAGAVLVLAATGLCAVQPDAQAASGLALATVILCGAKGWRPVWIVTALICIGSAVWAWTRPEALSPVPHVEGVLLAARQAGAVWGLLVYVGFTLVPLWIGAVSARRDIAPFALTALWLGFMIAGLTQRFPIPVIGFGLSWVLGWALTLGLARRPAT